MDNITTFAGALKELYNQQYVDNLVYPDRPLLSMVKKTTDFGGKNYPQPIMYANPNGGSATFASALANQTPQQIAEFFVTRVSDYQLATIDNQLIEAAGGDIESFLKATSTIMDNAIDNAGRRMATAIYRTSAGVIGQLSASSGVAATITLSNPEDIVNFEYGQTLVASTLATGLSIKVGTMQVTGVDRNLGTLTVAPSGATLIPVLAVSDYLYVQGDPTAKMSGLADWIPTSAPASTAFFGVDRTADTQRLSGVRYDGTGLPVKEAIINGFIQANRAGANPDYFFMNPTQFGELTNESETARQYIDITSEGGFGFKAFPLNTAGGVVKVVADRDCPVGLGYGLTMSTWFFRSTRPAPHILDRDVVMLRSANADAYEVRFGWYGNLMTNAPGKNLVVQLT